MDIALEQLSIRAAFFACPSCVYLMVPRKDEKQTKLLCVRNIRVFKAITFEMQKNEQKHKTVIHGWTNDATLYPVLQWTGIAIKFEIIGA
jgi:hypothetical protein